MPLAIFYTIFCVEITFFAIQLGVTLHWLFYLVVFLFVLLLQYTPISLSPHLRSLSLGSGNWTAVELSDIRAHVQHEVSIMFVFLYRVAIQ